MEISLKQGEKLLNYAKPYQNNTRVVTFNDFTKDYYSSKKMIIVFRQ